MVSSNWVCFGFCNHGLIMHCGGFGFNGNSEKQRETRIVEREESLKGSVKCYHSESGLSGVVFLCILFLGLLKFG